MRYSKLAAILLAACAFAASPMASATAYFQHGYSCRLVNMSSPYNEIPGSFYGTDFTNKSGSTAYVMCPVLCDVYDSTYTLFTSSNITSCTMYATNSNGGYTSLGGGTRSSGVTTSFQWTTSSCSKGGNGLEIQCVIPNNGAVNYYISQ